MSSKANDQPDVFLNVPDLKVDEIRLDVDNLEARLALQARLANLLDLRAGVDVAIEKVDLDLKGVAARAMLKVRLENVLAILDRALTSLDRNPRLVESVIRTVDDPIEGVARTVAPIARANGHPRRVRALT